MFAPGLENVDAYYALLKSRQVPLLGEPPNRPERGTRRYFRDPEGYLFAMAGPMGYIFV